MLKIVHPRKYNAVMKTIERLPHGWWIDSNTIAKEAGISILEIKYYLKLARLQGIITRRRLKNAKMCEWKKIE